MNEYICEICGAPSVVGITTPDGVLHEWCEQHMKENMPDDITPCDKCGYPSDMHVTSTNGETGEVIEHDYCRKCMRELGLLPNIVYLGAER